MTPAELQQMLQAGQAALKRGEKDTARDLLLQVIDADEKNETAWLWLAAAVESVDDQIVALENVLELNPDNASAQKGLAQLRLKQSLTPAPPPQPKPNFPPPTPAFTSDWEAEPIAEEETASFDDLRATLQVADDSLPATPEPVPNPLESVLALDDPYQCLYCGAPAPADLKRCPECNRSLMTRTGGDKLSDSLRTAALVAMACLALAGFEALAVAIFSQGGAFGEFLYNNLTFLSLLVGDFQTWPPLATIVVLILQFVLVVIWIAIVLGLLYQIKYVYYAAIGVASFNILWMVYRWRVGFFGPFLAVVDIVCSIAALFFIFASQPDFQINLIRLRCATDPHIKGGDALNRLGHIAKGQDQWALAVAYWRAAIAAMPAQADFYKDLTIGYAQIGYYHRALRTLNEYANQAADQKDVAPMRALIEQKQAQDPHPRD